MDGEDQMGRVPCRKSGLGVLFGTVVILGDRSGTRSRVYLRMSGGPLSSIVPCRNSGVPNRVFDLVFLDDVGVAVR